MLSELGKFLRNIRMNHGLSLKDMAEKLGYTSAYLSAIELGKRPAPDGFADKVHDKYQQIITQSEQQTIAKLSARHTVTIKPIGQQHSELAMGLARRINSLTPEQIASMNRILHGDKE